MNANRQLEEIISWRIITEIWRRFPKHFDLIEAHPSGGMADSLALMIKNEKGGSAIAVNRGGGSVHIFKHAFGINEATVRYEDWVDQIIDSSPKEFTNKIVNETGLVQMGQRPPSTPTTITYRYISEFLTHSIGQNEKWYCLNGFNDSSGFEGCVVRDALFKEFPSLNNPHVLHQVIGRQGQYAYGYWFLLKDKKPILCLDINGRLFRTNGDSYDLTSLYKNKRSIWSLICKTAIDVLP